MEHTKSYQISPLVDDLLRTIGQGNDNVKNINSRFQEIDFVEVCEAFLRICEITSSTLLMPEDAAEKNTYCCMTLDMFAKMVYDRLCALIRTDAESLYGYKLTYIHFKDLCAFEAHRRTIKIPLMDDQSYKSLQYVRDFTRSFRPIACWSFYHDKWTPVSSHEAAENNIKQFASNKQFEFSGMQQNVFFEEENQADRCGELLHSISVSKPTIVSFQEITQQTLDRIVIDPYIRSNYYLSCVNFDNLDPGSQREDSQVYNINNIRCFYDFYGTMMLVSKHMNLIPQFELIDLYSSMGRVAIAARFCDFNAHIDPVLNNLERNKMASDADNKYNIPLERQSNKSSRSGIMSVMPNIMPSIWSSFKKTKEDNNRYQSSVSRTHYRESPSKNDFVICTVHLESKKAINTRIEQMKMLSRYLGWIPNSVIVGDMNTPVSENHTIVTNLPKFKDMWTEMKQDRDLGFTRNPEKNKLAHDETPDRIDRVLFSSSGNLTPKTIDLVNDTPFNILVDGAMDSMWISDHFGLYYEFTLTVE